jgi:multidrug transporter EmrE-like cation transporter
MSTQTVWDNKAQCLVTVDTRAPRAAHLSGMGPVTRHLSFYVVFAILAAPLYWLLPAAVEGSGLPWRAEYALWAAVPISAMTVLARFLVQTRLRCF